MSGVNKIILLGRLGKDPESKTTNNGQTVCNFSMATSETYKDKATGEKKETTEWHNCVAWGSVGEIASKYLHKGDAVYVEGKMKTRTWEKDGVTRYVTEVLVNTINLIGGNKQSDGHAPQSQSSGSTSQAAVEHNYSDDLPF